MKDRRKIPHVKFVFICVLSLLRLVTMVGGLIWISEILPDEVLIIHITGFWKKMLFNIAILVSLIRRWADLSY